MSERETIGFERILSDQIADSGRPLHPTFARVLDGWIDPTARAYTRPDGEVIGARERTITSAAMHHAAEGLMGSLTPLAMIEWATAMLQFLSATDDELESGYHGIDIDPWGELRHLPREAREEFGRALWHIGEAMKITGLRDD